MELICYLSNGYPTIESSYELALDYADAGCNIIEIDFPSRDPYLESAYIKERMKVALERCNDYETYMAGMVKIKEALPNTKFILMIYENTILEIGVERFVEFCREHDFRDLILVGIQDERMKNQLMSEGLRISCYVQYQLLEEEIERAKSANGFVYLQAKPTNGVIHETYKELNDCIGYLRSIGITQPIYCGVGVHTPEDVKEVKEAGGDATFIGSAVLQVQHDIPKMKRTIYEFHEQC